VSRINPTKGTEKALLRQGEKKRKKDFGSKKNRVEQNLKEYRS